ncbi:hypothetical protein [Nocardia sp. NPDC050435]|uniref:hypothetical protein n=1 Tax=Nocardia sp. NPDC050435 TaxID=3155040 RepID=UPI0033E0E9B1
MTEPARRQVRVGDIAPEHAALLRRVHELAAESTRMRLAAPSSGREVAQWKRLGERLDLIHRERRTVEASARAQGIPEPWIKAARSHGAEGQTWTANQLLAPARTGGLRTTRKVAAEAQRLAHMAAIGVVRKHLRTAAGIVGTDADRAAAHRFRRNFEAVRRGVEVIAASTGMGRWETAIAFAAANRHLNFHIDQYLTYDLTALDALYLPLTDSAILIEVARSIRHVRASPSATANSPGANGVPSAKALLDHARHALVAVDTPEFGSGAAIETAISAAIWDPAALDWEPSTDGDGPDNAVVQAAPEIGPER